MDLGGTDAKISRSSDVWPGLYSKFQAKKRISYEMEIRCGDTKKAITIRRSGDCSASIFETDMAKEMCISAFDDPSLF